MSDVGSKKLDYDDGEYLKLHPDWHASRSPWKASQVKFGLDKLGLSPKTICDIGCGTGLALASLVESLEGVTKAVGFEPSPDAPRHPEVPDHIEIKRADASKSEEKFELGIMLDVFEHVEDYFGFLKAMRPIAKYHAFHIPMDASLTHLLVSGFIGPRNSAGHLHYFTRPTALQTLEDCGYKVRHWHYTKSTWEGPDRRPWSPLSLVRRTAFKISQEYTQRLLGGVALLVIAENVSDAS